MSAPGKWIELAECNGVDTDIFYPGPGDKRTPALAKKICARCPVINECAEYGREDPFGIWGGETPRERNKRYRTTGDLVPALGSARRLRALARLGYGPHQVEIEALDLGIELLNRDALRWIRAGAIRTDAQRAAAITKVYEHLVEEGYCRGRAALFARRQAAREEWPSPREWAGLDIDDPLVTPQARAA